MTYRYVPDFHRDITLAHLTQVERDGGYHIFRPLIRAEDIDESVTPSALSLKSILPREKERGGGGVPAGAGQTD